RICEALRPRIRNGPLLLFSKRSGPSRIYGESRRFSAKSIRGSVRNRLALGRLRGVLLHAAQEIEGRDQLLVVCRIRRDVSGRTALLFFLAVRQVAAQARLALSLVATLQLLGYLLQNDLVRLDALGLD